MNLATLPDDELLQVLGFLGNRELLRCRGVCRRLRDAALHPHLWRKRRLTYSSDSVQLSAAVLRLVPCLGFLELSSQFPSLKLGTLLTTTNCAISRLHGDSDSATSCVLLAMVLARQATLGRLTSVDFDFGTMSLNKPELQLVLHQLLQTQGLTSVRVTVKPRDRLPLELPLPKAAKSDVPASLRNLEYWVHDATMLTSYLQWHADTLQVVNLKHCKVPAGTATLLGSLPRLQKLTCPMMANMEALLQCPGLKTLYLDVRANDLTRQFLPGVQQFLRQAVANRLEDLTLEYEEAERVAQTVPFVGGVNLVRCLAGPSSSAPSALRTLTLTYKDSYYADRPQPPLQPLAAVLHRLHNLESLDLGGPPTADFLAALDGRVLPRLERLRVYLNEDTWGGGCPHEWAHGPDVRDLLRKYPRLHLDLLPSHLRYCDECDVADHDFYGCDKCKCFYCAENNCHDFVAYERTLFSHPEDEACNQQHSYHTDNMRIVL